jgi:beta-ureidopropionase / N-carbamoyl-L-amino-acid hydrolase
LPEPIQAADLAELIAGLEPIGNVDGATTRLAWTPEHEAAAGWFTETAARVGMRCERDPAGNLWACPEAPAPWWAVGSHLDTVREGGRYDGALGVVAGFAIAARSEMPVAVISFADEEGARFNTPTFGSRALAGALDPEDVLARVDERGVTLADAMRDAGVDPAGLSEAPAWLDRLRGILELHIDQSRDVAERAAPVAMVEALAARMRVEVELRGAPDHAGTTRRPLRRDGLLAAARLIVRADDLAGAEMTAGAGRILVEPNAPTTVPAFVRLWLDARAPRPSELEGWWERLREAAGELQRASGVKIEAHVASSNRGTRFDPDVRRALADAAERTGLEAAEVVCFAGHDAGVIAPRRPTGMILVRNETGVSHAPGEDVSLEDAATAARIVQAAVEALAREPEPTGPASG